MTVDDFIAEWKSSGGNERANTQTFINDLCELLGVQRPRATQSDMAANDYVFERHVIKTEIDGTTSNGWIDCYKRDSFILEAKQGSDADIKAVDAGQGDSFRDFFGQTAADRYKRGMAKRGTGQWTGAMQRAAGQAEGYAKALPTKHGWPPFLLVSDIGYCIDVYADFQLSGKGYAPFPDRRRFRITLDDLHDEKVRKRLAAIWQTPMALDPSAEAARVTRGIAGHLATLAKRLEAREQNPDRVAAFLMRLLFTMFSEDTGLIPKESFSKLLKKVRDRPENLVPQLSDLWSKMDKGGFVGALGEAGETVRQFNGYLFRDTTALPLEPEEIDVVIAAAASDWRQVEPAIFGTLLERALDPKERAKLGAHYTPRAYVERLVGPTIMEPLREDWLGARTAATKAAEAGDKQKARKLVEGFHGKLARTKVLDPACGTGNFLYVSMARMKELEGEVLELLQELGDDQYLAEISGHTITPENFLGIEINPRAAAIAQLVLWIGYLQWHFRVNGEDRMPEAPVLRDVRTIENRDALITWDKRELERDQYGKPVTRWDGETTKKHAVTGRDVPDEAARVEVYRYVNPKVAKWPKADFIIGNPPFISGGDVRRALGDGYFGALSRVEPGVPAAADLVMHWWNRAALLMRKSRIRRFGFITTNSAPQLFGARVIASHLNALDPLSIVFAVPDHPWVDEKGSAAVRVALTVCEQGPSDGRLQVIIDESGAPDLVFSSTVGTIRPNLRVGVDINSAGSLKSNLLLAAKGIIFLGEGFLLTPDEVASSTVAAREVVRGYVGGRDFTARPRMLSIIDVDNLTEEELRSNYPEWYDRLINLVMPVRAQDRDPARRRFWWKFGRRNSELRAALQDLQRYVGTTETAKHRVFQFVDGKTLPDQTVVAVATSDSYHLGVLSSRIHVLWATSVGGRLGVGNDPRYNKTRCFDLFQFPGTADEALKDRIRDAAEKLDALRKDVLARHEDLTLTKLYNVLEALRAAETAGTVLSEKDRDIATRGCVSLIRQYHETIDTAVAEAYGWPADLSDEQILELLVALNKERAAEEAKGNVRWLRPDFQQAGYVAPAEQTELGLPEDIRAAEVIQWPGSLPEQVVVVAGVVERAGKPVAANDVARAFKGKRAASVVPVLDALAGMGRLRKLEDGRYAA